MADAPPDSAQRPRRSGPRWWLRLVLCALLGLAATLLTSWAPEVARALRVRRHGAAAVLADSQAPAVWLTDAARRPAGTLKRGRWLDQCEIDPAAPGADRPLPAGVPASPLEHAPRWALRPPPAFSDGFKPPTAVDSRTLASGWPFRAMRRVILNAGADGYFAYEVRHSWDLGPLIGLGARLPVGPIWDGLALTAGFWAGLAAVPLIGLPALRRRRRVRSGRCAACGYPGAASDVCSECGRRLPDRPAPRGV